MWWARAKVKQNNIQHNKFITDISENHEKSSLNNSTDILQEINDNDPKVV